MRKILAVVLALSILAVGGAYALAFGKGLLVRSPKIEWSAWVADDKDRRHSLVEVGHDGTTVVVEASGRMTVIGAAGQRSQRTVERNHRPQVFVLPDGSVVVRYFEPEVGGRTHVHRFDAKGRELFERVLEDRSEEECVGLPEVGGIAGDASGTWVALRLGSKKQLDRLDHAGQTVGSLELCSNCVGWQLRAYAEGKLVALSIGQKTVAWVDDLGLVEQRKFEGEGFFGGDRVLPGGELALVASKLDLGCGFREQRQLALLAKGGKCLWTRPLASLELSLEVLSHDLIATPNGVALLATFLDHPPGKLGWLPGVHDGFGLKLYRFGLDGTQQPPELLERRRLHDRDQGGARYRNAAVLADGSLALATTTLDEGTEVARWGR